MERCIRAGVFVLVVLVVGVVCTVTLSLDVAVHPEAALRSFQRYCDRVSFDHDPARPHFVPWLPSDSVRSRRVGVVPNRLRFPEHVVFTTQNNKPRYQRAYAKAYEVLKDMRVRVGIFNANNVRVNAYGYPYLKDMYLAMMETYPWAHTYTYVNADILFNATAFLQTADALVYASLDGALSTRFLAVGHRRNVAWDASDDFGALLNMSVQFQDDAQDYFITSRALWDWRDLPDLVVGRRAYDNWLVQCAVTLPGVDAVDVTLTNPAVHLTVRSNKDGHSGVSVADVDYNNIVIAREDPKWHPHLGRMSACPMYTELNNGAVRISMRRRRRR